MCYLHWSWAQIPPGSLILLRESFILNDQNYDKRAENLSKEFANAPIADDMTNTKSVVVVDHIHKEYGTTIAVDDVPFSIAEGEIFGIIGPNWAGKTTTVECISGRRVLGSGPITVFGLSPQNDRKELSKYIGVELHESSLPPRIKIQDVLGLFASFYSNPVDPDYLLESLGISEKRNTVFKQLSGGQKQRLSIALALVGAPKIAVLDGLATGLDPDAQRETWELIENVRDRGVTVILVTHYMDEAERLCDRVALITRGRVVALDTPAALAAQYGGGTLEDAFVKLTHETITENEVGSQ